MTRANWVLVALLLASSLHLVHTSYEARRLFADLDRARVEQHRLDAEFRRLDAERQAQATNLRVERLARDRLAMRPAGPDLTTYVTESGTVAMPARAAAGAGAPR